MGRKRYKNKKSKPEPAIDPFGYRTLIKTIFPGALVVETKNFPNSEYSSLRTYGWLITITPFITISFLVRAYEPKVVFIHVFTVFFDIKQVHDKIIFSGQLPQGETSGVDLDFLTKVLQNHRVLESE